MVKDVSAIPIATPSVTPPAASAAWTRLVTPSVADCFSAALLIWLFASGPYGWLGLLGDGDTGWHIRTGEYILDNRKVPSVDFFSYTKPGEPWFAWEWLSATIMGALHRTAGLKGVVLAAAAAVITFSTILLRQMIWRGSNLFLALLLSLLGVGASSIHYLARPHLFTLVLLPLCLWLVESDRRQRTRTVWLLVPMTAVWVNLHGGFLALVACLGLLAAGSLAEQRRGDAVRYGGLAAACAAASILNPYGYKLHLHLWEYVRSDWIRKVVIEFQSPAFRDENVFQFEILLFLALGSAGLMLTRRKFVEPLWIIFWAHQALVSARHITVFVAVSVPIIAAECTVWWDRWTARMPRSSIPGILDSLARDRVAGFRWNSVWCLAPILVLASLNAPSINWPTDFPEKLFPTELIGRHERLIATARVFTADDWADYLLYRHYPQQKVFFDGRSDFYGPKLGDEFIRICRGGHDWEQLLERYQIDVLLVPADWALASLLKGRKGWKLVQDDGKAVIFQRHGP
jgi:hypothetical protein